MESYINSLLSNYDNEIIINIYLVAKAARNCCLLEYANFKNKYSITNFYKIILNTINHLNSISNTKITIYEENIYPYPRLLICNLNDYTKIFNTLKSCHYKDYEYQLGTLLDMLYPGDDFCNFHKPRITGRIFINNICLYAETFIINNYEMDYCCLDYHLSEKINKFNSILSVLNIKCDYSITHDDGLDYRIKQINKNNTNYVAKHIGDYLNDIYNDHIYSNEQLKLINSFVKAEI
jgi:hypothetical protein